MARRGASWYYKKPAGGGWALAVAVVAMAALACLLISPPKPEDVAAVFSRATRQPAQQADPVALPAMAWYLVEAEGRPVAARGALLEAELLRQARGGTASVRLLTTDKVSLRFTAPEKQLAALRESAGALVETLGALERMTKMQPADAQSAAAAASLNLSDLTNRVDRALAGVENQIARGLAGLAGSCREAMAALSQSAQADEVSAAHASLALQYASYVAFLQPAATQPPG